MKTTNQTLELHGDRELVLTRYFAAPVQLVWEAHTDCAHLSHWWGPKGWELTHCKLELKIGGKWHYCMSGEHEGNQMQSWGLATYQVIAAPNRLVYQDTFSDQDGNVNPEMPEMIVTILLTEQQAGTLLTNKTLFESTEARQQVIDMGMEVGITQTWDRLDTHLTTM